MTAPFPAALLCCSGQPAAMLYCLLATPQAPGVAKYQPRLMYPRPSPGTLEVDPSMQVGRVPAGIDRRLTTIANLRCHGPCHAMPTSCIPQLDYPNLANTSALHLLCPAVGAPRGEWCGHRRRSAPTAQRPAHLPGG